MADDDATRPTPPPPPTPLRAVIDDAVADGTYCNLATIMSGPVDFFFDFGRVVPGRPEFKVLSRVIMSPAHAKQFAAALSENLRRYERSHGSIPVLPEPPGSAGFH